MTTELLLPTTDTFMKNVSVQMVTPQMARDWLGNSMTNRNLRLADVEKYARDMTRGDWEMNYDPIRFTHEGHLLDGQHRLHAIIMSGVSIPMLVIGGFDQAQQITMDTGIPRKFHDVLKIRGEHSYFDLAALLRKVAIIEDTGTLWHLDSKVYKPSTYRMLRLLDEKPEIRGIINKVYKCREYGLPKSVAGGCWYQFNKLDPYDCAAFFDKFIIGANLAEDDPTFLLRRILMTNNSHQANRGAQMWKAALTIKAWNKFRDGEPVISLSWRRGGATPEKFPEPH